MIKLIAKYKKREEDGIEAQSRLYPPCPRVNLQVQEARTIQKALRVLDKLERCEWSFFEELEGLYTKEELERKAQRLIRDCEE